MDESSEFVLKKFCCTCLSRDRKLSQLCRLREGINNLYIILSHDSEAFREGFFKDTASWYICWECWAIMTRISKFRSQACMAQRQLTDIVEGRTDFKLLNACLSHLTVTHKSTFDRDISEPESITDNFIDCGIDIKTESDDDIPLSHLHNNIEHEEEMSLINKDVNGPLLTKGLKKTANSFKKKKKGKLAQGNGLDANVNKALFCTTLLTESEMNENRLQRRLSPVFAGAMYKCESCIDGFKTQVELDAHINELHVEKEKHNQCDICLVYVKKLMVLDHREEHYSKYECKLCDVISYSLSDISEHLKTIHGSNLELSIGKKKGCRITASTVSTSKSGRNQPMMDKKTQYGYLCTECDKYFENKNKRWKHIQRQHRDGYKCKKCDKKFTFKNSLSRHEMTHNAPLPREKCPICQKMVRVDLIKIHARIHTQRDRYRCEECDKCFVSRASYEHHLKYTQAHSAADILKYKCAMCDKGYRSRGELRDHVNYNHMGKTQHKCPVCGKALATRRCITRHVKRAHDGIKENAKDKICQQCGKAFRDKKGLREHEFTHTGERPLSCEICGCTFRQSASLYTHRKRVHKIFPSKKNVTLLETM